LLDRNARVDERDDAAMDLGSSEDEKALDVLKEAVKGAGPAILRYKGNLL